MLQGMLVLDAGALWPPLSHLALFILWLGLTIGKIYGRSCRLAIVKKQQDKYVRCKHYEYLISTDGRDRLTQARLYDNLTMESMVRLS